MASDQQEQEDGNAWSGPSVRFQVTVNQRERPVSRALIHALRRHRALVFFYIRPVWKGPGASEGRQHGDFGFQSCNMYDKRKLIREDPAPGYRLPPPVRKLAPHFTPEQVAGILKTTEEPYKLIYEFLALTGLRSSELQWLTKDDLGPEAAYVHVREKTCPITGEVWKPKHGRERIVPLPARASAIARHVADASPGPWLFCRTKPTHGKPGRYDCQQLLRPLKVVLKALGIKHGSIHTFRHSYITHLVNAGMSIFDVKELVGHDKIATLEAYYHHQQDRLADSIRGLDFSALLGASPSSNNGNSNKKQSSKDQNKEAGPDVREA